MPAPADVFNAFKNRLIAAIDKELISIVDEIWDASQRATLDRINKAVAAQVVITPHHGAPVAAPKRGLATATSASINELFHTAADAIDRVAVASMSPQKRGAQNRVAPGVVKNTVESIISRSPEGRTRDEIRKMASTIMGQQIKEGSLKQSLRLLSQAGKIENRDRVWFPKKIGGQPNG